MSLINWFNKPKWKSKDQDIRLLAVKNDQSKELISELPSISENDESEMVRIAALKRLSDYQHIAKIANSNQNSNVKNTAIKMLQDWVQNTSDDSQLGILKSINNHGLIEHAARHSGNKEIRSYCIGIISKQGVLAELIFNESDKELRQIIAKKITKPATLKRVAKTLKNKDKSLAKDLLNRLETKDNKSRIAEQKALDVCAKLEQLVHNSSQNNKNDIDNINLQWQDLSKQYDLTKFQQRFEGALQTAKVTLDPELRNEFLSQQRTQRIKSKINDLETALEQYKDAEWKDVQKQIAKFSGFDLTHATNDDKEQFETLLNSLKSQRDEKSKEFALPDSIVGVVDNLEKTLKQKFNQPQQIKKLRSEWEKHYKNAPHSSALQSLKIRFDNAMAQLTDKVEASSKQRDEAAKNAVAAIAKAKTLIKDGHLIDAKIAINKIAQNKKMAGQHELIQENKFAFDTLWNELKELRQWQTWSNDKVRTRIIEDLKALIGTGTHPDTVLKKMKDANKFWKELEESEKLEGDKYGVRNREQWHEFREVQKALFEPAQPYFEKRSEIWNQELEKVQSEIKLLESVDLNDTEDRELARMVRNAAKQMRSLDKVPPKQRGAMASGLRAGIKRLDKHLSASYEVAVRRKQKLIDTAKEYVELEDLEAAIDGAKNLQSEWKNAGIVNQAQERKLWKEFRKVNDSIFNRLQLKRNQEKQENNELFESAKTLISDTRNKIQTETSSQATHSVVEIFKNQFNELRIQSKALENQAKDLIQKGEQQIQALQIEESLGSFKTLADKAQICTNLEIKKIDADKAQTQWDKLGKVADSKLEKSISKRFEQAKSETTNDSFIDSATQFLIAAEYLTGTATPEHDKEKRLNYQVEILSKRMSGEESLSVSEQASKLLTNWYLTGGTDKDFLKNNTKRIASVSKQLYALMASS